MVKPIETIPEGVKHIHCIGIGGSGMFPLVQILHGRGYTITGSDNNESDIVNLERQMGIEVMMGQRAENIRGADLILYSAAIMDTNPELIAARESGLPLWERAKMLGAVSSWYSEALGVCGTHGKTTTTAMIVQILYMAGLDPSAVIGGKLRTIGGYGRSGATQRFVYEACEFKDTFLSTHPDIALVLNIDNDHMEYFHTVENAMKSYTRFAQKAHTVLYNGSDEKTCRAMEEAAGEGRTFLTFGWEDTNDYYPANLRHLGGLDRRFTLMFRGKPLTEIHLQIPGDHNILNAIAAAAGAMQLGATPEQAALLQDKGFARAFALRCLPREVARNLWSQAEFDTVTAKKLCELREQFWKDTVQLSPERMAVVLQELYARGATIVSNEHGYGIYFRKEDTLYFVEMMADSDRAAEILMEAAREKEVIVEKAVITVGAAQPLFLGEGTRQEYGMIRFDAEPFDVSESYLRLMLEN